MFNLYVALKYLRSHKIIYFSIAGIAIGIMVLIIVVSVMNGFSRDIRTRIKGINSSFQIHGNGIYLRDYNDLIDKIRKIAHVKGAAPRVEQVAWLGKPGYRRINVRIIGIDLVHERDTSRFPFYFGEGSQKSFDFKSDFPLENPPVVVGSEVPVAAGQNIGLTTVREDVVPRIFNKDFTVVGTFKTGMYEYDSTYVVMKLHDAQKFLRLTGNSQTPVVNYISVEADDYGMFREEIRQDIINVLHDWKFNRCRNEGMHEYGVCGFYRVSTWEELKHTLLQAVNIERNIQTVIIFFIVIVAGFNIVAIFTLLVRSKVRDIGILRAFGCTKGQIYMIFLYCGAFASLVGALCGVVLGLKVSYSLNDIAEFLERYSSSTVETFRGLTGTVFTDYFGLGVVVIIPILFFVLRLITKKFIVCLKLVVASLFLTSSIYALNTGLNFSVIFIFSVLFSLYMLIPKKNYLLNYYPSCALLTSGICYLAYEFLATGTGALLEVILTEYLFSLMFFLILFYAFRKSLVYNGMVSVMGWIVFTVVVIAGIGCYFLINNLPPPMWQGLTLFPKDVYYLDRIPAVVDYNAILITVVSAVGVGLIASIYPAISASSLEPVVAIRNE